MAEQVELSPLATELLRGVAVDHAVMEDLQTGLDVYDADAYQLFDDAVRHVDGRFRGKLDRQDFDARVVERIHATAKRRGDTNLGNRSAVLVPLSRVLITQIDAFVSDRKPAERPSN